MKDYTTSVKELYLKMGDSGKMRLVFDLASASPYNYQNQVDSLKKI